MGGNAGGGGNGGRTGGNQANDKQRMTSIIQRNIETLKTKQAGLTALESEVAKIEAAGQFNYGKRDFALWKSMNDASIKASRDQSILKIRTQNILKRAKKL